MKVVEVTRRSRKFGWGYSTTPTGDDAYSIEFPSEPQYTGTVNQVYRARSENPYYNNLGGVCSNSCWFYNGKPIYAVSETDKDWEHMGCSLGLYLLGQFADGEIDKLRLQLV